MRIIVPVGLAAVMLAGCAAGAPSPPDREPEAVGTASAVSVVGDATNVAFTPDPGYEYFEGTTFVLGAEVTVSGAVTDASAIEAGDRLNVWSQVCAESFPVQCTVEHVEVLD